MERVPWDDDDLKYVAHLLEQAKATLQQQPFQEFQHYSKKGIVFRCSTVPSRKVYTKSASAYRVSISVKSAEVYRV